MTKIWIEDAALRDKVERLVAELNLSLAPDGRLVDYQVGPAGKLEVADQGEGVLIVAPDLPHFFHGLALWNMRQQADQTSSFSQPISFSRNGLMLDNSRNAVAKVDYVKSLLRRLAVLGHSWYMLYMEDVYEIPEQPYFGAFRGRYSQADLRELDAYAQDLGIELVPCVQTLAHLNQFFQWEHINSQYADLADVLHVGREETYTLIDQMLASLSSCFTTKRIHLGMDEAYDLGRGHYLDQVGLRAKTDIMLDHLARIKTLCDRYDLEPIIWDDMFFSWYNQVGEDEKIDIPEGISLMYWDYYQHSTQAYLDKIAQRRSLGAQVSFAGGAWRWTGYTPHHRKTLVASLAGLAAARQTGIQEVMATAWGDDSSESPFEVAVFGLVLYSYLDSHADYVEEEFSQWLSFFTGLSLSDWLKQGELDLLPVFKQLVEAQEGDQELLKQLADFVWARVAVHLRNQSVDMDQIQGIGAAKHLEVGKANYVAHFLKTHKDKNPTAYKRFLEAVTRVVNLGAKVQEEAQLNLDLAQTDSEAKLLEAAAKIDQYKISVDALYMYLDNLVPVIEAYFDDNKVNADDETIRANRLATLKVLTEAVLELFDSRLLINKF